MCVISAIFSFYLLISAVIPIAKYGTFGSYSGLFDVGQSFYFFCIIVFFVNCLFQKKQFFERWPIIISTLSCSMP